jgi:zinc protease
VSGYVFSGLSSQMVLIVTARDGHTLEEIRTVMDEEIDKLRAEPPTAREVQRVINDYEASFLEQAERLDRRADMLNRYYYYVGDPGYFQQDLARYKSIRPSDIKDFVSNYLGTDRRVTLSIVPEGQTTLAVEASQPVDKRKEGGGQR